MFGETDQDEASVALAQNQQRTLTLGRSPLSVEEKKSPLSSVLQRTQSEGVFSLLTEAHIDQAVLSLRRCRNRSGGQSGLLKKALEGLLFAQPAWWPSPVHSINSYAVPGAWLGTRVKEASKTGHLTLAGVAQWTECQPANHRVAGSIPSQGTCLGCRPGPQYGVHERQPYIDVSLPLFAPPFSSV